MALPDLTGQNIQDTYNRLLQISSSGEVADGTGSLVPLLHITASHASYAVSASHEITYELSSSHAESADTATSLSGTPSIYVNHITASGNISASGEIISTGNITTDGILYTDDIRRLTDNSTTSKISMGGNNINVYAGSTTNPHVQFYSGAGTVFNPQGYSIWDFTVEGNTDTHLIFADAGADKVAIGTNTVSDSLLTVDGDVRATHITASGDISGSVTSNLTIGGTATANTGSFHILKGDTTKATGLSVSGYIEATHITASGDISSSGFVYELMGLQQQ